jgi:hypothetical protein
MIILINGFFLLNLIRILKPVGKEQKYGYGGIGSERPVILSGNTKQKKEQ